MAERSTDWTRPMRSLIQTRSCGSVKIFWLNRDLLRQRIRAAATKLGGSCPEVRQVVLFGSAAEGRDVPASDVDILLVLQESQERFIDRPLHYGRYFEEIGRAVDLFIYTQAEIERGNVPLATTALKRGAYLFARAGI